MKKLTSFAMMILAVMLLLTAVPVNTQAASISLSAKKITLVKGKSKILKVKGTKKKVTWSSSKKSVATVNAKGKVTAKKKGTATITARIGTKKLTCKVTVNNPSKSESLVKKNPFIGDLGDFMYSYSASNKKLFVDNMGKQYPYTIYCCNYLRNNEHIEKKYHVTYALDKKYQTLTFSMGLSSASKSTDYSGWLEFYSGSKKIYETTHFKAGVRPKKFTINVSNVRELTVVAQCDASPYTINCVWLSTSDMILKRK